MTATPKRELRGSDLAAVREQLGREPTIAFEVVARCTGGHPLVIRNATRDDEGHPFPTTYWLTCPEAVKVVSRLESEGAVARLNQQYDTVAGFAAQVDVAHEAYALERAETDPDAGAWGGVGGTRRGLKCLHAHYAYHLSGGEDPAGAWTAAAVEPVHPSQRSGRVAAVDQGTNSCRLIVVEPAAEPGGEPTELARDMIITRLGRGVDRTGMLDPAALERTLAVLERYVRRARALGSERIRVGATSAVRDAGNRRVFVEAVARLTGGELEVITGEHEAALSFLGATRGLDPADGPFLVLDIGGGSTESVVGAVPGIAEASISTQIGSVRLTERLVTEDPPGPGDLGALEREIDRMLDEVEASVPIRDTRTFVSVAGTATTVQAIALGLSRYDPERTHRTWLALSEIERVLSELSAMTNAERAAIPVMAPGRGDVIVAGVMVLVRVMRRFGFDRTLVSETDILDGLALEMLGIG